MFGQFFDFFFYFSSLFKMKDILMTFRKEKIRSHTLMTSLNIEHAFFSLYQNPLIFVIYYLVDSFNYTDSKDIELSHGRWFKTGCVFFLS